METGAAHRAQLSLRGGFLSPPHHVGNLGMAMAASNLMMATTNINSMRGKPFPIATTGPRACSFWLHTEIYPQNPKFISVLSQ